MPNQPIPEVQPNDLIALQALQDAMMACNAAETIHLQHQCGGTYGLVHDAFIDAATALIGKTHAERLMYFLIDCNENVTYCLDLVQQELCVLCHGYLDRDHCPECGTCKGDVHSDSCSELSCLGHNATDIGHYDGPAGLTLYCRGACYAQSSVYA